MENIKYFEECVFKSTYASLQYLPARANLSAIPSNLCTMLYIYIYVIWSNNNYRIMNGIANILATLGATNIARPISWFDSITKSSSQ